jgi:hypothetical protein
VYHPWKCPAKASTSSRSGAGSSKMGMGCANNGGGWVRSPRLAERCELAVPIWGSAGTINPQESDIGGGVASAELRRHGGAAGKCDCELAVLGQGFIGGDDEPWPPDEAARTRAVSRACGSCASSIALNAVLERTRAAVHRIGSGKVAESSPDHFLFWFFLWRCDGNLFGSLCRRRFAGRRGRLFCRSLRHAAQRLP